MLSLAFREFAECTLESDVYVTHTMQSLRHARRFASLRFGDRQGYDITLLQRGGGNRGVGRGVGETFRVDSRINVVGVEAGYS